MIAAADSRPRVQYRLPGGRMVDIIFDHGEFVPQWIEFQLADGRVVDAWNPAFIGPREPDDFCCSGVPGAHDDDCFRGCEVMFDVGSVCRADVTRKMCEPYTPQGYVTRCCDEHARSLRDQGFYEDQEEDRS